VSPQVSETLRQIEQLPAPGDLPSGFPTALPTGLVTPTALDASAPGVTSHRVGTALRTEG